MNGWVTVLAIVAALGAGLVAGTQFAFSTFVMQSLAKLPPAQGIAAMQSINVVIMRSLFMVVFLGMVPLCLVTGVTAVVRWGDSGSWWLLAASLLYLLGTIVVTIAYHVPRNDAMAALDPTAAESAIHWARYVSSWTAGNHLRTIASLASSAAFILAIGR